ncbi:MAG: 3-methyladenine DNA glycosylase 2 [Burkholderiales bacterium]
MISTAIELPANFRVADLLTFHRRDVQQLSERVEERRLQKGLSWNGRAACLDIRFEQGSALAGLAVDGATRPRAADQPIFERMVLRMLGLAQPVDAFEAAQKSHLRIGRLIAARPGLRVPLSATPFEALVWAIAGQQISLTAALSLRRRLIAAAGLTHSSGLACHPDAAVIAAMDDAQLRAAGFSQAKARAVLGLAREVESGALPLEDWSAADATELPVDEIRARLSRLYGIGPWTIDYALLRGFGWLDGSLHGDVAVRRRLQELLGASEQISEKQARLWLAEFTPWRALVAAHLWASKPALP